MRDMPFDKVKEIARALHVAGLMARHIAESAYDMDDVPTNAADTIAQDAAIVSGRVQAAIGMIDDQYPGFIAVVYQVAAEDAARAKGGRHA